MSVILLDEKTRYLKDAIFPKLVFKFSIIPMWDISLT